MKKLKYILFMIPLLFAFSTTVNADMFEPSRALQYYEYYVNGSFREASFNYGQNIELASPTTVNYPYAISLILYGNYKSGNTYTIKTNVLTYFESDYFKFYYDHLDYFIMNSIVTFGAKKSSCNLNPIVQNSSYSISCTFTPEADLSQIVIGLVNQDWQNNGYVPFGSSDYVRFTDYTGLVYDNSSDVIIDQNQTIIDQNNQTNDKLDNIDDTLTDSTIDNDNVTSNFEEFNNFLDDNSTITQLITLPITLYTAILNNLSSSCQPFSLGSMYGEELVLPCVNIGNYLGSTLWGMIDLIISGFAVYAISKKLIKVFNTFSSMKEGDVIDD